jgi:hypothetical protein
MHAEALFRMLDKIEESSHISHEYDRSLGLGCVSMVLPPAILHTIQKWQADLSQTLVWSTPKILL